jgi:thiamine transporter
MKFTTIQSYLIGIGAAILVLIALIYTSRKKFSTKTMVTIAVALALSTVLSYIKLFKLPQGGSITLASMVPIILVALIYGTDIGVFTGILYGLLQLLIDPYVVHPVQLILDYPAAFMMLGLAGIFKNKYSTQAKVSAVVVAMFGRFLCHYLSGIIFFGADAPKGTPVWEYSLAYNGSFMGIEMIITAIIFVALPISIIANEMKKSAAA